VNYSIAVRGAIRSFFESKVRFKVCGEASNGLTAFEQARKLRPDCPCVILLDVSMQMSSGEAASSLRSVLPGVKIVAFTMSDSDTEPLPNGFDLFFSKRDSLAKLAAAIETLVMKPTNGNSRNCHGVPGLNSCEEVEPRILVVDDFEPWRQFVCSTLQKLPHLRNIVQSSDGLDAVRKAQELQPDLILLDVGLPNLNGIEVARQLCIVSPNSKILFLSENHDPEIAAEALGTGARGYIVKPDAGRELLAAVKVVMTGKRFVSQRLLGRAHPFEFERWQAAD
jgi:DNA-binding NarL/FixJ family response regulator